MLPRIHEKTFRLNYKIIIKSIASEKTGHNLRTNELTLTSQMVYPLKKVDIVFTYVIATKHVFLPRAQGLAELHNLAAKPSFYIDDKSDVISFLYTTFKSLWGDLCQLNNIHIYLLKVNFVNVWTTSDLKN